MLCPSKVARVTRIDLPRRFFQNSATASGAESGGARRREVFSPCCVIRGLPPRRLCAYCERRKFPINSCIFRTAFDLTRPTPRALRRVSALERGEGAGTAVKPHPRPATRRSNGLTGPILLLRPGIQAGCRIEREAPGKPEGRAVKN